MDAFGFFDSEDENQAVLVEAARVFGAERTLGSESPDWRVRARQLPYTDTLGWTSSMWFGNPEAAPFEPVTSPAMWIVAQPGGAV